MCQCKTFAQNFDSRITKEPRRANTTRWFEKKHHKTNTHGSTCHCMYKSPYARIRIEMKEVEWTEKIKRVKNIFSAIFHRFVCVDQSTFFIWATRATVNKLPFWICAIVYTPFANLYTAHVPCHSWLTFEHVLTFYRWRRIHEDEAEKKNGNILRFIDKIGSANGVKSLERCMPR